MHARPGLLHLASTIATSGPIANFCGDLLDSVGEAERGASMGGVCGHVFREGEIVWTCRQCGVDDTCVLCEKCFRNSNHVGHDVRFHRSSGNGGCCDCGDFEAWAPAGCCPAHGGGGGSSSGAANAVGGGGEGYLITQYQRLGPHLSLKPATHAAPTLAKCGSEPVELELNP